MTSCSFCRRCSSCLEPCQRFTNGSISKIVISHLSRIYMYSFAAPHGSDHYYFRRGSRGCGEETGEMIWGCGGQRQAPIPISLSGLACFHSPRYLTAPNPRSEVSSFTRISTYCFPEVLFTMASSGSGQSRSQNRACDRCKRRKQRVEFSLSAKLPFDGEMATRLTSAAVQLHERFCML